MKETRDSIAEIWGQRTPYIGDWPVRVDERSLEEPEKWVQSACILCSNCCGMDIGVKDGRIVGVRGRAEDRVNKGRLGPKGLHGWVANHSSDRLTCPLIRRNGQLEEASWDEAMDLIVQRSQEIGNKYTSGAIGFYTTGQLFLEEYPLWLTTGRLVYHFHTRTKTGHSKELQNAAPDAFVQISCEDAERYGISEGDMVDIQSRRGRIFVPARVGDIEPGLLFVPFHYGYWDNPGRPRAVNELTITQWDPVSKQPHYKYAAVRIRKVNEAENLADEVNDTFNVQGI